MKELENASARFHITRLEALMFRIQNSVEKAYGNEIDQIDKMIRKTYTEGYYHSIFELQKGVGIGFDIGTVDQRTLDKLVVRPWSTDGLNFSDRVWKSKADLIDAIHKSLVRTCALGKPPDKAIAEISKRFDVSKGQAGRLIMTEQAYFNAVAQRMLI